MLKLFLLHFILIESHRVDQPSQVDDLHLINMDQVLAPKLIINQSINQSISESVD